jgi:hypothetical protein
MMQSCLILEQHNPYIEFIMDLGPQKEKIVQDKYPKTSDKVFASIIWRQG